MNALYTLMLLLGLLLLVAAPDVRSARTRDFQIASVLSELPATWTISLDSNVAQRLSHYAVKDELVKALEKRCKYESKDNTWFGISGTALIVLSIIGLIRERKISASKKTTDTTKLC